MKKLSLVAIKNALVANGFSDEEITQFDSMLARILENCKEAE